MFYLYFDLDKSLQPPCACDKSETHGKIGWWWGSPDLRPKRNEGIIYQTSNTQQKQLIKIIDVNFQNIHHWSL